jgi:hypothetical protein
MDTEFGLMCSVYKGPGNEIMAWMNSSGAKLVSFFDQVRQFGGQERDRDIVRQELQFVPFETRHDDLMREPLFKHELPDVHGYRRIFQFDVQQASATELIKNIGEKRNALTLTRVEPAQLFVGETRDGAFAISRAIDAVVVNDDEPSITAPAHVKFETGGSGLKGLVE